MASIYQRTNKDGSKVWRAVIRKKGYPIIYCCNGVAAYIFEK